MNRKWLTRVGAALTLGTLLIGCQGIRKLGKSDPSPRVSLFQSLKQSMPDPVAPDTVQTPTIITFTKQDGTAMHLLPITVDSLSGDSLMSVSIETVVIRGSAFRNVPERNGRINVDFIVSVPDTLQHKDWQLVVDPLLTKNKSSDTLTFDPLVYSGRRFREMQEREYAHYDSYVQQIADTVDYSILFGDNQAYSRYMQYIADKRDGYAAQSARLAELTPEQAKYDPIVGWASPDDLRRQKMILSRYIQSTDRVVARRVPKTLRTEGKFDYLADYLTPRYIGSGGDALPGGEIYTRIEGRYPDDADRNRESYLRSLAESRQYTRKQMNDTDLERLKGMATDRAALVAQDQQMIDGILRELSDSSAVANHRIRKQFADDQVAYLSNLDSTAIWEQSLRQDKIRRNDRLIANKPAVFARRVPHPYVSSPRLDTVIRERGRINYHYTDEVMADENTSKLYLFVDGAVRDRRGRTYRLAHSDTLVYNVASMTNFIDTTHRYMRRVITRDAEANHRFFFVFPSGETELVDTLPENRRQLQAVHSLTRALMTDPIYIIDSITLLATASPEGAWQKNDQLARERSLALKSVLRADFQQLYDSLSIDASISVDENGRQVVMHGAQELPDLPNILKTKHMAEYWPRLVQLIREDEKMANKQEILAMIDQIGDPDVREMRIRSRFPNEYAYMRSTLYPQLRAVDFRFNLHRRGMQLDTVYTTEIDSEYMHTVELLRKRRYQDALDFFHRRGIEDRNTALAYMSLGYDIAAYRILSNDEQSRQVADVQYMLAILASRLNDEEKAVQYFLRSVELKGSFKFRGNLDPEISRLIRKYGLFQEDFQ